MTRVAIFVLALLISVYLIALYLRRTGMFFPDRYPSGRWDVQQFMIVPSEHTFASADGVKLHAWLFRADDPHAPVLIWFHGNAGNITNRADMAVELARRGVSVFLFDYRGYGKSEGQPKESKLYLDSLAAFDYVRSLHPARVAIYGESLGGPYAAFVAKERKDSVRAVIMENSFSSLKDLANAIYAPLPLGWTAPLAMRTSAWLNEAGVPVLVLHGKRDMVVPYRIGRKLYDDLRVPKEMITSDGAG
ncbi:MAG TPA: alpha/beta fold hydrolase, partial [Thermoanaerobaculia bacterium]|nr:alpha/beta fold hydrolase [Thermoanaerobaculia bacterium]